MKAVINVMQETSFQHESSSELPFAAAALHCAIASRNISYDDAIAFQ